MSCPGNDSIGAPGRVFKGDVLLDAAADELAVALPVTMTTKTPAAGLTPELGAMADSLVWFRTHVVKPEDGMSAEAIARAAALPETSQAFASVYQIVKAAGAHIPRWEKAVREARKASEEARRAEAAEERARDRQRANSGGDEFQAREGTMSMSGLENAERFLFVNGHRARFSPDLGGWLCFDGKRWVENGPEARQWAHDVARQINLEIGSSKDETAHAAYTQSANGIREMLSLSEPDAYVRPEVFDVDPLLFNVENGTIDLRSGELRPHAAADLLTRISPIVFDPEAKCPRFERFLEQVQPDPLVREFLQRFAGYAMTGSAGEHVFPVFYGTGRNGKGVFYGILLGALGGGANGASYGAAVPPDLLMKKRDGVHPTGLMTLRGKRLAVSVEPKEGCELDVATVKMLTGGDPITARLMHKNFVTFNPTHTNLLVTNHKPKIAETKNAIWARVFLILWGVEVPKADQIKDLDKLLLQEEGPGILAWLVRGCLEYQRIGLSPPASIIASTAAYRVDQDILGAFFELNCVIDPEAKVTRHELFAAYQRWAEENGEDEETLATGSAFIEKALEHGFEKLKNVRPLGGGNPGHGLRGIRLMTRSEKIEAGRKAEAEAEADAATVTIIVTDPEPNAATTVAMIATEPEAAVVGMIPTAPEPEPATVTMMVTVEPEPAKQDIVEPDPAIACPSRIYCQANDCEYAHPKCRRCMRRRGDVIGACRC